MTALRHHRRDVRAGRLRRRVGAHAFEHLGEHVEVLRLLVVDALQFGQRRHQPGVRRHLALGDQRFVQPRAGALEGQALAELVEQHLGLLALELGHACGDHAAYGAGDGHRADAVGLGDRLAAHHRDAGAVGLGFGRVHRRFFHATDVDRRHLRPGAVHAHVGGVLHQRLLVFSS